MSESLLRDRVVFVTGAGSGIGRAAAQLFAEEGAAIFAIDRDEQSLDQVVGHIVSAGGRAGGQACDVARLNDVADAVNAAVSKFGRIDGAFNNAGIAPPAVDTSLVDPLLWQKAFDINVAGIWHCLRAELTVMEPGGSIVNTASVAGMAGLPGSALYSATKHAVVGLTRSVAAEYGPRGIRVNAIAPGLTRTAMVAALIENGDMDPEALVAHSPLRRMAEPREIGEAALWLLSNRSSFVTGHVLAVDGGELAV
ncbi:SDR family NAD(P)-dependent oxidoreductase [Subtercola endophyticus]|uniref:SDR family NAD(P)-dependent oxidoreductase n=1 Tax=Subtercola endophyticus TaxID=2895559 RepID=UPI001E62452C|nr:SDR family oxidoreductase [Subtercola endophyticus]UFS59808.1 SDR family oxidoreductase [Subtercola endophyticus]